MIPRVLLIDNYDSFTYNLLQALQILGAEVEVVRNDAVTPERYDAIAPTHLVVSPGPGHPDEAGASPDMIRRAMSRIPVLGVCLGHQAIASVLGATVGRAQQMMHGKSSPVYHDGRTVFEGLSNPFPAGRYHSLSVSEPAADGDYSISAYTSDGEIMGIRHRQFPTEGIQFHPESVLTPDGNRLLRNFLDLDPPGAAA